MSNLFPPMSDVISIEHDAVVRHICDAQKSKYTVFNNLDGEKHFIGNIYPDIILIDKSTNQMSFIIEVKRNGLVGSCLQQWKSFSTLPATLYIIVPQAELPNAKLMAAIHGVKAKFGWYIVNDGVVTQVGYE